METIALQAIWRVVSDVYEKLDETITVDDMARTAMFSKFHFTRVFQRVIGVSPGRFLSAIRLQRAKQLLVTTPLNVTEISHRVGYASVSTFSSRFASNVGVSPTAYRRTGGYTPQVHMFEPAGRRHAHLGSVSGRILAREADNPGLIFVGLFPHLGAIGQPARCAILTAPGPYVIHSVSDGAWHVVTHSLGCQPDSGEVISGRDRTAPPTSRFDVPVRFGAHDPVTIHHGTSLDGIDIRLGPSNTVDPAVRQLLYPGFAEFAPSLRPTAELVPAVTRSSSRPSTQRAA